MPPEKKKMRKEKDSSSSDSDSGPDDRNPVKKAAGKETGNKVENETEPTWQLDKMRFVKVREFKGRRSVDIREYYESNGKTLPGKRGISLNLSQWNKLCESIEEINKIFK